MEIKNGPRPEDTTMTSPEILKVKTIKALLEALEEDDEDDAKQAIRMIRALIGEGKGEAK